MYFGDPSTRHTKDPAVVRFREHYWLYYSCVGEGPIGIGIAVSHDLEHWRVAGRLVPEGAVESNGIAAPGAIVLGDRIHLFYQSYGNGTRDAILHAWSTDGVTFTRNRNPIVRPAGGWTCGRAIDADVIQVGPFLHMYWATRDPGMRIQMIGLSRAGIDTDFGPDAWEQVSCDGPTLAPGIPARDDPADLDLAWEQDCLEAPAALMHNGNIYLFYGGAYNNAPQQVGCAVSPDGIHFRRLNSGQPLMTRGPLDSWNESESGHPFAFSDNDGRDYLFFQGDNVRLGYPWHLSRKSLSWGQQADAGNEVPILATGPDTDGDELPILLRNLESPILFRGDATTAYRDPALLAHDGVFHLFFTLVQTEPDGSVFLYAAHSRSADFVNWSEPQILTPRDRALNFSSPGNVIRVADEWILCLQTYPRPNGEKYGNENARIWIMRSKDLETWSEPELLRVKGDQVACEDMGRMIDPYLVEDPVETGKWWCFFKQNGISRSWSRDLRSWTFVGHMAGGENVCLLPDGSSTVMLHSPENGIGVRRTSDWKQWQDEGIITLGQSEWPWAQGRLTAGFALDLHADRRIRRILMVFHGSGPEDERTLFDTFCSIGVAWSRDFRSWSWPGKPSLS